MIQRIQSIFLLLAAGFFGGQFLTSFVSSTAPVNGIFADQIFNLYDNPALLLIAGLGALVAIVTIFLFNNRKLQLKLSYLIITLSIILPIVAVLLYTNQVGTIPEAVDVNDQAGLYLPIGTILFTALAIRFINKDEKTVRSMDRLR